MLFFGGATKSEEKKHCERFFSAAPQKSRNEK